MSPSIFLTSFSALKQLGLISSQRDYAEILGQNPQWISGLRRRDGGAPREVRHRAVMRLRRQLLAWRDVAPKPSAMAIDELLLRLDEAEAMARWLAR
jgi:hypothetical protein